MKLYEDILADANRYGLQVVFHGCTIPRGWERMYPNYVASEAALASENIMFSEHHAKTEGFELTTTRVVIVAIQQTFLSWQQVSSCRPVLTVWRCILTTCRMCHSLNWISSSNCLLRGMKYVSSMAILLSMWCWYAVRVISGMWQD